MKGLNQTPTTTYYNASKLSIMINRIYATLSMTILATALVSTTAIAARPTSEVISKNCNDGVHTTLISSRPVTPSSNLPITAPSGGGTEKKTCETTNAPGTNEQGENGTNRCTTCTYSSSGHVSVKCIFKKAKTPSN
ncbi:hypothetical protein CAL7102_04959 [Dulcicalothrix desertica PCC 7102]|nr:hypothetical protein CAL7102_04959 [Dulcicalothrix desertica PCC 7102]